MSDDKSKDTSAIAAGLVGAAVGAIVAAGSIALADGKKRKLLEKLLEDIKDRGAKIMEVVSQEAKVVREIATGEDAKPKTKSKAKKTK